MRVFDFDGTIYDGDSTVDFYRFALREHPAVWKAVPRQVGAAALYGLKRIRLEEFKGRFYAFLAEVPDAEALAHGFWRSHWEKVKPSVAALVRPGDYIASASPAFLLKEPAERLGAHLIASEVDARTGALLGPNCRDEAKRQRLIDAGLEGRIDQFYSDSKADAPCVALAERGVLVTGDRLEAYPRAWVADCSDAAAPDRAGAASR